MNFLRLRRLHWAFFDARHLGIELLGAYGTKEAATGSNDYHAVDSIPYIGYAHGGNIRCVFIGTLGVQTSHVAGCNLCRHSLRLQLYL